MFHLIGTQRPEISNYHLLHFMRESKEKAICDKLFYHERAQPGLARRFEWSSAIWPLEAGMFHGNGVQT